MVSPTGDVVRSPEPKWLAENRELHRDESGELRMSPLSTELNTDEHMHVGKQPKDRERTI